MAVEVSGDRLPPGARRSVGFMAIQPSRAHEYVPEQVHRHIPLRLMGAGDGERERNERAV